MTTKLAWISTWAAALCLLGCDGFGIDGNGQREVETREVEAFSRVRNDSELDLQIQQGEERAVKVSLDSNLIPLVRTHVADGTLFIGLDDNVDEMLRGPHLTITVPELSAVKLAGSGNVELSLEQPDKPLDVYVTGSGNVSFAGSAAALGAYLDGSGDIRLAGAAQDVDIRLNGSGDIRARDLDAKSASIELNGSGDVAANVSDSVSVSLSGSGDVDLYGGAHIDSYRHDGSGDIVTH